MIILKEIENNVKLDKFFKHNDFERAIKFSTNNHYKKSLLAEISRLHGDHYYDKKDYSNAIKKYNEINVEYLEPSYVIKRFLDVT